MTFSETKDLLETMIEDARRVCIRSPILFRMSTREKIIKSVNTRYGVDHGPMFRTLTTSTGIKEIIQLSASYFNSLDPAGTKDKTQQFIRPKFLQMLVLLLSFLNDRDLGEIAEFLEATYKIRADRRHIELLILKVVPLMSINSTIFIKSLIPAIEGYPLTDECNQYDETWDFFVTRLLQFGYLLPGGATSLGRDVQSWAVKWPDDGFRSSDVFNHLQYAGCRLRAINDIPPIEIRPESSVSELTVFLTNGDPYVIGSEDLERIICLLPGNYSVVETGENGKTFDLRIDEHAVNEEVSDAIRSINDYIRLWNMAITAPPKGRLNPFGRLKMKEMTFLNDIKGCGRLTRTTAILNNDLLAVAYKIEGRKVARNDLIRNMSREIREMMETVTYFETRTSIMGEPRAFSRHSEGQRALNEIKTMISTAETRKQRLAAEEKIADEPIEKVIYPGSGEMKDATVWNDYNAWHTLPYDLHIEAKCSTVKRVTWLSEELIEVNLDNMESKFHVSPLEPVEEAQRADEIQVGDVAMLAGRYMVICVPSPDSNPRHPAYWMQNYLKVRSMEEQNFSRRGMNRMNRQDARIQCIVR